MSEESKEEKVSKVFTEAFRIFQERNAVYGDATKRHGEILSAMFPDGLTLKGPDDFCRFAMMGAVIAKMNRYAQNFNEGGHRDSAIDPINMLAMLVAFDEDCENEDS